MRILITGANGFLGSHLVEEALKDSKNIVFSGIRKGANLKYLEGYNTQTVILEYQEPQKLLETFQEISRESKFDLIIHNAGLTKSNSEQKNLKVNKGITENILGAIRQSGILSKKGKFLYISSLAALGPVGAGGPVSSYGRSKLEAEKTILKSKVPYLVFRPTAIYGPKDHAFLAMFKVGKLGLYPIIVPGNQKITMIYGPDVARLVLYYAAKETDRIIHLDDGQVYSHEQFKRFLENTLNRKIFSFRVPGVFVITILFLLELWSNISRQKPVLSREKYHEIKRDWNHDFPFEHKNLNELNLTPLNEGFLHTLKYYKKHNLL